MRKHRIEPRHYRQPVTLRTLVKCGFPDPQLERLSAVVGAARDVFLAKRKLVATLHPWKRAGA